MHAASLSPRFTVDSCRLRIADEMIEGMRALRSFVATSALLVACSPRTPVEGTESGSEEESEESEGSSSESSGSEEGGAGCDTLSVLAEPKSSTHLHARGEDHCS